MVRRKVFDARHVNVWPRLPRTDSTDASRQFMLLTSRGTRRPFPEGWDSCTIQIRADLSLLANRLVISVHRVNHMRVCLRVNPKQFSVLSPHHHFVGFHCIGMRLLRSVQTKCAHVVYLFLAVAIFSSSGPAAWIWFGGWVRPGRETGRHRRVPPEGGRLRGFLRAL